MYNTFLRRTSYIICIALMTVSQGVGAENEGGNCGGSISVVYPNISSVSFYETSQSQIIGRINECLEARKNNTQSAITEYYCPSNDTNFYEDQKAVTSEVVYYNIAVETIYQEIDKNIDSYMKGLQCERNVNVYNWRDGISTTLYGDGERGGFGSLYERVCDLDYVQGVLHYQKDPKNPTTLPYMIRSSSTYPQSICRDLATKKTKSWDTLGNILMAQGVPKGIQNDKDSFLDKVKGTYKILLDKLDNLLQIIDRATSKITGNNTKTVQ